jgi:LacI family transcriptional regulator
MSREAEGIPLGRASQGGTDATGAGGAAGTEPQPSRTGIREIAARLGLSIGTVDRALHDRPGISRRTRDRVLETARLLGYRPNLAARALQSRRAVTRIGIGVRLARGTGSFAQEVREGVLETAEMLGAAAAGIVDLSRHTGAAGPARAEVPPGVDGVVLVAEPAGGSCDALDEPVAMGLPCVLAGASHTSPMALSTVCVEPATVGGVAADLLGRALTGGGRLLAFTGAAYGGELEDTLDALSTSLAEWWPRVAVERAEDAGALAALRGSGPCGVFVAGRDPTAAVAALHEAGLGGCVTVVAAELTPALGDLIADGRVAAAIDRSPFRQGEMAFRTLYRYLAEGLVPPSRVALPPQVVMRANLALLDRSRKAGAEVVAG